MSHQATVEDVEDVNDYASCNEPQDDNGPINDSDDDATPETGGSKKKGKLLKPTTSAKTPRPGMSFHISITLLHVKVVPERRSDCKGATLPTR